MSGQQQHVLVTGGSGYIGSHTTVQLLNAGYKVTVIDSLVNSSPKSLDRVRALVGEERAKNLTFIEADLVDKPALEAALSSAGKIDSCIHFAGLKAVGESVKLPLLYYHNNLTGTFFLLEALKKQGCTKVVFSSSATVYGTAAPPLTESSQAGVGITNPYGRTKFMLEEIFRDVVRSDETFGVVLLRYFNPVGAHASGTIGESPNGIPNNLMPYVQQVAVGRREKLTVYGNDYDTHDGTGVRDYIHVEDLAAGHLAALKKLDKDPAGCFTYNLGTGTGYSVLDMVKAMEKAAGKEIPYVIGDRRPGDLASVYCDPVKAKEELGWEATLGLEEMCAHAWKWQSENPNGFDD
jgi:UDP-glucose 4-epimerase